MAEFTPNHLGLTFEHTQGNGERGRLFFLPGSPRRAERLGKHFDACEVIPSERGHTAFLGIIETDGQRLEVGAVATGMGCPSIGIVASELILLGARLLLRVGTAGSLQPQTVRAGSLVVATGAVRDEGTSDAYAPREYPAVADLEVVNALCTAARRCGCHDRTFAGVVHTKDSLYARELGQGPLQQQHRAYMTSLRQLGVLASEMEAAHLFVLANAHSQRVSSLAQQGSYGERVRAGALLAVVGDDQPFAPEEVRVRAEDDAIQVALTAARLLLTASTL